MSSRSGSIRVHGLPFCFPSCFEQELRKRIERFPIERTIQRHMARRVPLGLLMLSRADVTAAQLHRALAEQGRDKAVRIGECMQRLGYVEEPQITAALAMQWQCPVLNTIPAQIRHCGLPHEVLSRFQMLPVHFLPAARTLHVAFSEEIAYRALVAIEQMLDYKTEVCLTTPTELNAGFERLQQHTAPAEKQFTEGRNPDEMARVTSSYAARLDADNVKVAACGDVVWARIESGGDSMNLLFQRPRGTL